MIAIEGQFEIELKWYQKNRKIFGSIIEGQPFVYFIDYDRLTNHNFVIPIFEGTSLPKTGWELIDLR